MIGSVPPGAPGDSLHGENGGFRPVIYLARALDSRLDPDYIKIRVEKENKNVAFPVIIDDTCQNCTCSHACVLAAAALDTVKLLKLPQIANN